MLKRKYFKINILLIYLRKLIERKLFKYSFLINTLQIFRYYFGFIFYLINTIFDKPYIGGYLFSDADTFRGRYVNLKNVVKRINKRDIKVLEIGCYAGQNTIFMGKLFKVLKINYKITCLDLWNDYEKNTEKLNFFHNKVSENLKNGKVYDLFIYNIEKTKMSKHVLVKKEDSFEYLNRINENFDLILIDGSHSYKYVYRDILNSKRLVNNNGFIIGDDYEKDYESTKYLNFEKAIKNNFDTIYCEKSGINFHPGVTKATHDLLGDLSELNGQFIVKKDGNKFIDYSKRIVKKL